MGGKPISKVDELKTEIDGLPQEEFAELVRWLSEKGLGAVYGQAISVVALETHALDEELTRGFSA